MDHGLKNTVVGYRCHLLSWKKRCFMIRCEQICNVPLIAFNLAPVSRASQTYKTARTHVCVPWTSYRGYTLNIEANTRTIGHSLHSLIIRQQSKMLPLWRSDLPQAVAIFRWQRKEQVIYNITVACTIKQETFNKPILHLWIPDVIAENNVSSSSFFFFFPSCFAFLNQSKLPNCAHKEA